MKRQRPSSATPSEDAGNDPASAASSSSAGTKRPKRSEWPEDKHREFVSAIFEVGLKHSSPTALLEHMTRNENLTVERVKSHLQKYRLKRDESKQEFLHSYEDTLAQFKSDAASADSGTGAGPTYASASNKAGEPAALLTHATMAEDAGRTIAANPAAAAAAATAVSGSAPNPLYSNPAAQQYSSVAGSSLPAMAALAEAASRGVFGSSSATAGKVGARPDAANSQDGVTSTGAAAAAEEVGGAPLRLPHLSEEERNTPLGKSMVHMVGLFFALKDVLLRQRAEAAAAGQSAGGGIGSSAPASGQRPAQSAQQHSSAGYLPAPGGAKP